MQCKKGGKTVHKIPTDTTSQPQNEKNMLAIWTIAVKDMRAVGANIQVWLPMILLPVVFGAVVPFILLTVLRTQGVAGLGDLDVLSILPENLILQNANEEQQVAHFVMNYMFAPFFLLIPLMCASVISADSFAGEKERGTLETLLYTPVDIQTMLLGKALAAFIPAIGLSFATLGISALIANIVGWSMFGAIFFPTLHWLPLMVVVIPTLILAAILVNVFVSAKVATFQAAYQIGGITILPILALLVGQVSGVLLLSLPVIFLVGLVLIVIDIILLMIMRRYVNRMWLFESQVR